MNAAVENLVRRIRTLEDELEVQMALGRAELHVRIEDGKVAFEQAVLERHRAVKTHLLEGWPGYREFWHFRFQWWWLSAQLQFHSSYSVRF